MDYITQMMLTTHCLEHIWHLNVQGTSPVTTITS